MGLLAENSPSIDAARGSAGIISFVLACVAAWAMEFDVAAAWLLPWGTMLAAWGLRDHQIYFYREAFGPDHGGRCCDRHKPR